MSSTLGCLRCVWQAKTLFMLARRKQKGVFFLENLLLLHHSLAKIYFPMRGKLLCPSCENLLWATKNGILRESRLFSRKGTFTVFILSIRNRHRH
jgi:hypothetical protein